MSTGRSLPPPGSPVARYVRAVRSRDRVFVSGHGPLGADGTPAWTGCIGDDLDLDAASEATRLTVRNVVATLAATLGGPDELALVEAVESIRLFVVARVTAADSLAAVAAAAFADLVAGASVTSVTTIGVASAVFELPITIDATFAIQPARSTS